MKNKCSIHSIITPKYLSVFLAFIFILFFFADSSFGYQLGGSNFRHFYYEDGTETLKVQFNIENDEGEKVLVDVIESASLNYSNGDAITSDFSISGNYRLNGTYNSNTGDVDLLDSSWAWDSRYVAYLDRQLPEDEYRLDVTIEEYELIGFPTYTKGELPEDHQFNLGLEYTTNNNILLEWTAPDSYFLASGYNVFVFGYVDGKEYERLKIRAPGDLNSIVISNDLLNLFQSDYTTAAIEVISADSRYISNEIDIAPVPIPGAVWLLGFCLLGVAGIRGFKKS